MKKTDDIEKAKWQIGEVRVDGKGVAHECYGYDDNGKAQIRRVKKSTAISAKPTPDTSKKTPAATPAASTTSVPNNSLNFSNTFCCIIFSSPFLFKSAIKSVYKFCAFCL